MDNYDKLMDELHEGMTAEERKDWARRAVAANVATCEVGANFIIAVALGKIPGDCFAIDENGKPIFEEHPPIQSPEK